MGANRERLSFILVAQEQAGLFNNDVNDEENASSISDDEFNEIIDMLKNRRKAEPAKNNGTQLF